MSKRRYLVWDVPELLSLCSKEEIELIDSIIGRMIAARTNNGIIPQTKYIVVSEAEPFYQTVKDLVDALDARYKGGS